LRLYSKAASAGKFPIEFHIKVQWRNVPVACGKKVGKQPGDFVNLAISGQCECNRNYIRCTQAFDFLNQILQKKGSRKLVLVFRLNEGICNDVITLTFTDAY